MVEPSVGVRVSGRGTYRWRHVSPASYDTSHCNETLCSEQVHLGLGGPGEVIASWVSASDKVEPEVVYWPVASPHAARKARGTCSSYSQLLYLTSYLLEPPMGIPGTSAEALKALANTTAWALPDVTSLGVPVAEGAKVHGSGYKNGTKVPALGMLDYRNPSFYYTSPVIHTVVISSLKAGQQYAYRVNGDSRNFSFVAPPDAATTSHTKHRNENRVEGTQATKASVYPYTFGLIADLGQTEVSAANVAAMRSALEEASRRDGLGASILLPGDLSYADGWFSRWDSFGRMIEPLAAQFPVLSVGGNHEFDYGEGWVSYMARWPTPHLSSRSSSPLWWSRDIGPAHVIGLCSYADTADGSLQRRWLERDLARVDRKATPWIIALIHVPWYSSNAAHLGEGEPQRRDLEPLLHAAGTDVVLSGHVHSYERTHPVADMVANEMGAVHLNLGCGGNREGASFDYEQPQPEWSAFRESSFGIGTLRIVNATHARLEWHRTACESADSPEHETFNASCHSIEPIETASQQSDTRPGIRMRLQHEDASGYSWVASESTWIVRHRGRPALGTMGEEALQSRESSSISSVETIQGRESSSFSSALENGVPSKSNIEQHVTTDTLIHTIPVQTHSFHHAPQGSGQRRIDAGADLISTMLSGDNGFLPAVLLLCFLVGSVLAMLGRKAAGRRRSHGGHEALTQSTTHKPDGALLFCHEKNLETQYTSV